MFVFCWGFFFCKTRSLSAVWKFFYNVKINIEATLSIVGYWKFEFLWEKLAGSSPKGKQDIALQSHTTIFP